MAPPPPPLPDPSIPGQEATGGLVLPPVVVGFSPDEDCGNPGRTGPEVAPGALCPDTLVQLPVWLWVKNIDDVSNTVTVTNGVETASVTATGHITSTAWSLGDGSSASCAGPGTADTVREGRDVVSVHSPTCEHVFHVTSGSQPGAQFRVGVTVTYTVTWVGWGGPYAGRSGVLTKTVMGERPLRVGEAQTVVVP